MFPTPPRSFTHAIFHAVFDARSSFFALKPYGNACYAGYVFVGIIGGGYISKGDALNSTRNFLWQIKGALLRGYCCFGPILGGLI